MTVNEVTAFTPNFTTYHSSRSSYAEGLDNEDTVSLSFQIMTRAEPLEVVTATIESLLAIKSANDEILIIDNNHTDKALYEPLAAYCVSLPSELKVRFYHVDKVDNFKSGALNLALELMDASCSHIVVVDSDYQALPHAREAIAQAIVDYPTHALLQFPQFYRDKGLIDVHSELNHYFNYHLYRPFNRQRALSTGTFAVIRRQALTQLGGWSGASITEDAQIGVLMHRQGLKSQFIPKVIATGLLPNTLPDLICQRQRWIYGNMQVLSSYFATDKQASVAEKTPFKAQQNSERLSYIRAHLSQLSAWVNFTGLFILLQLACVLMVTGALLLNFAANFQLLLAPLYAVFASYALFLGRRFWAYSHDSAPLNQQIHSAKQTSHKPASLLQRYESLRKQTRAWLLHLNFWEFGALSWMPVLWGRDKPFICTPKQANSSTSRSTFIANIRALPKLLLMLNLATLLLVAPFSPLYSPVLFIAALVICLIKVFAASVALDNYRYQRTEGQIINFKTHSQYKAGRKPSKTATSLAKAKSIPSTAMSRHSINKACADKEAASS
jgi:cellulose synthase/poly-beta-1,6-N-acetylglucosamine synthase-like glycosyltransferase